LVESNALPLVRLGTLYRQEAGSLISENAHRIAQGVAPRLEKGDAAREADFFFLETPVDRIADVIADLVARRLPEAYGLDPRKEIQVLTPGHRGAAGATALNRALQARLNPNVDSGDELNDSLKINLGDRVLQTRNNYDRELFNGDLGEVTATDATDAKAPNAMTVQFDDRTLVLSGAEMDDLDLAWALTVHKSQGSEYPAVVLALSRQHSVLLSRSLVYTAVTRARRLLVIVGERRALNRAVADAGRRQRFGHLPVRLRPAQNQRTSQ